MSQSLKMSWLDVPSVLCLFLDKNQFVDNGVIPCQINKEFRVTSRILMKLVVFVVPMVLITHANF